MKKFYIYDANGKYMSEDGQQRFSLLTGKALYDYLQTPEGKKKQFYSDIDDNGDEIGVEVPAHLAKEFEADRNRTKYVNKINEECGYELVSLSAGEDDEGNCLSQDNIADEDADVQKEVFKKMDLDTLRYALSQLDQDEYQLIAALFLSDTPLTIREYAMKLGVGAMTVCDRKKAVFKKIKSFF